MSNLYESSSEQILEIAKKHNINEELVRRFLQPERIIEANFALKRDDGTTRLVNAFRSQHNSNLGPYKGGIRIHQNVTRDEVMALSLWMSLKCAVSNLPYGGGKGGMVIDPKELSEMELETLSKSYAHAFYDVFGAYTDIPAPDVNSNPKIIAWMLEESLKISKEKRMAVPENIDHARFTGKPLENGGLKLREESTGLGGVLLLNQLLQKLGKNPKDMTIAIQGFGNVGYHFASHASKLGLNVIAVSDSKGGIMSRSNPSEPLDIDEVMKCKKEKGYVAGCYCVGGVCDLSKGKVITNEELLTLPVDILVPSALENVITNMNMNDIKASIIVEMANGPVSTEAYEFLSQKGVTIIPDILANSGGVVGSFIEWKQNIDNTSYSDDIASNILDEKLSQAFNEVWDIASTANVPLREAALVSALKKITAKY